MEEVRLILIQKKHTPMVHFKLSKFRDDNGPVRTPQRQRRTTRRATDLDDNWVNAALGLDDEDRPSQPKSLQDEVSAYFMHTSDSSTSLLAYWQVSRYI